MGVIALYNLSPRNGTQAYRIGGKHLYQRTHLTNPYVSYSETFADFLYFRCLMWFSEWDFAYWSSERLSISSWVSQLKGGRAGCRTKPRKENVTLYNVFVTPCGIMQIPVTKQGCLPWCSRWDPRETLPPHSMAVNISSLVKNYLYTYSIAKIPRGQNVWWFSKSHADTLLQAARSPGCAQQPSLPAP